MGGGLSLCQSLAILVLSRFGFIVQTNRQNHTQTRMIALLTWLPSAWVITCCISSALGYTLAVVKILFINLRRTRSLCPLTHSCKIHHFRPKYGTLCFLPFCECRMRELRDVLLALSRTWHLHSGCALRRWQFRWMTFHSFAHNDSRQVKTFPLDFYAYYDSV